MQLRELKMKDAELMLEWMQDEDITGKMFSDFASKTIEDCRSFIGLALEDRKNVHKAIVDDKDEYMGTVSLKSICKEEQYAEFAITVRASARGKGYAQFAMKSILSIARIQYDLNSIYWCVNKENARAINFYSKLGYQMLSDYQCIPNRLISIYNECFDEMVWYRCIL